MTIEFNNNNGIPMELIGINAAPYINKYANLCPYCKNAQTHVIKLKDIEKKFDKPSVQYVWRYIVDNDIKLFSKKDLMRGLGIEHISNGFKQDQALCILIMLGYLRKEDQEIIVDGKLRDRNIFIKNAIIKTPGCLVDDKHIDIEWKNEGVRKYYFNKKNGDDE